ncbi:MAG: cyclase family protein [Thermoplasmatales archaeon]|nr:cyclase family protein [Thermoplasmatales archaeon]
MFIQLSYKIDVNTPAYGGKQGFLLTPSSSIEKGDSANTAKWEFPNHIGTHIDFPYHFFQNGQTVEDFPTDFWFISGEKIQILEINLPDDELLIKLEYINKNNLNSDAELIIFKTGIGKYRNEDRYWEHNPGISIKTAEWIRENFKKIRIIGFDSISISSWQHQDIGRQVHKKLLDPKKPVLFIEDMDLSKVDENTIFKTVVIAPMMVKHSDGGPCTILAEVEK